MRPNYIFIQKIQSYAEVRSYLSHGLNVTINICAISGTTKHSQWLFEDHLLKRIYAKERKELCIGCQDRSGPLSATLLKHDGLSSAASLIENRPVGKCFLRNPKFLSSHVQHRKTAVFKRATIIIFCMCCPSKLVCYIFLFLYHAVRYYLQFWFFCQLALSVKALEAICSCLNKTVALTIIIDYINDWSNC